MPRGVDRSRDPGNDLTREGILGRIGGAVTHWLNGGTITQDDVDRYSDRQDRIESRRRSKMFRED